MRGGGARGTAIGATSRLVVAAVVLAWTAPAAHAQWVTRLRRFASDLDADDVGVRAARARLVAAIAR